MDNFLTILECVSQLEDVASNWDSWGENLVSVSQKGLHRRVLFTKKIYTYVFFEEIVIRVRKDPCACSFSSSFEPERIEIVQSSNGVAALFQSFLAADGWRFTWHVQFGFRY